MNDGDADLTILVNTCDLYSDIWPLFFAAFNEYWPECKYKVVLNTEELFVALGEGVEIHNFNAPEGGGTWGGRLKDTLHYIDTDYVLALYDDFILEDFFDGVELRRLIEKMDAEKNIAAVYLIKLGLKVKPNSCLFSGAKGMRGYAELEDKIDYRLNSAPALWRREDLLKYTGEHDNPWAWEVFGSYRTFGDGKVLYCPTNSEDDIYTYNYSKGGAIYRGKWVRDVVVDKNIKYKLNIDFSRRGFSSDTCYEKRSFKWKVEFLILGYKMVGLRAFIFLYRALIGKFL